MSIIISRRGKDARKAERTNIGDEKDLQGYICENPESLPLDEIEENIRLLILAREFPTRSGEIDALGIDYDGNIYVIETKLNKNQDKRFVLAQVLDYGASLWRTYEDSDSFIKELERSVSKINADCLTERIGKFYQTNIDTTTEILQKVRQNLRGGYFRFVVLMDYIEDRLRDLLIFVNQNSRFNIYGVEMEFYKFEDYEILIPKLYGAEVKKDAGLTKPRKLAGELNAVHETILKMIDCPLRKNEIMQRLMNAGVSLSEKTVQRRLQEAVEAGQLVTPMKGYYAPVQLEPDS
ncbi:MAG TPA: hypothetical protein VEZ40_15560 [Pyrinomonadaceae bacterium]|nr:hypothetical protein [Pyrinomonadaceae bacterium]